MAFLMNASDRSTTRQDFNPRTSSKQKFSLFLSSPGPSKTYRVLSGPRSVLTRVFIPKSTRRYRLSVEVANSIGVHTNSRPFFSCEACPDGSSIAPTSRTIILLDKPAMLDGLVVVFSLSMIESLTIYSVLLLERQRQRQNVLI